MLDLLAGFFRWLLRQGLTLLLILAVLVGFAWVKGELKRADRLTRERAGASTRQEALSREIAQLKQGALERFRKSQYFDPLLARKRAERQKLWDENFWTRSLPGSDAWTEIKVLDAEIAGFERIIGNVAKANESGSRQLEALQQAKVEVDRQLAALDTTLATSFVSRVAAIVDREFPVAIAVLIGILLVPLGIKAFLYYVVAPWAAGRPPMRLLPAADGRVSGREIAGSRVSAVSIPVVLGSNEELLIQPDYLQSSSVQSGKDTKWLLNWSIPFASLLSGMYLLTRVSPAGAEPVVLSSTKDPLSELGILELGENAAFVVRPRALAGVIQDRAKPIRITRHWRFGLQAWLTLQLRFLAFHGPAKLVVKGCRGICVEPAGKGRLINQAATLGFSAQAGYGNSRCETFISYWRGKEELFNDLFSGDSGVYVYEETPAAARAAGIGRPLEGFTDALLKAFGV
ncbi:MAG TPA: hypothetical protein VL280_04795 [Burkholderiales bacterium]|jgi:hypothetical protein|nr:hypothetical protein [Burkholderiales bacterium]